MQNPPPTDEDRPFLPITPCNCLEPLVDQFDWQASVVVPLAGGLAGVHTNEPRLIKPLLHLLPGSTPGSASTPRNVSLFVDPAAAVGRKLGVAGTGHRLFDGMVLAETTRDPGRATDALLELLGRLGPARAHDIPVHAPVFAGGRGAALALRVHTDVIEAIAKPLRKRGIRSLTTTGVTADPAARTLRIPTVEHDADAFPELWDAFGARAPTSERPRGPWPLTGVFAVGTPSHTLAQSRAWAAAETSGVFMDVRPPEARRAALQSFLSGAEVTYIDLDERPRQLARRIASVVANDG